jgi:hypothetical protein
LLRSEWRGSLFHAGDPAVVIVKLGFDAVQSFERLGSKLGDIAPNFVEALA